MSRWAGGVRQGTMAIKRGKGKASVVSGWHGTICMIGHGLSQEVHCLGLPHTYTIHCTKHTKDTWALPFASGCSTWAARLFPSPTAILRLKALDEESCCCLPSPTIALVDLRISKIQALQGPNTLETMHTKAPKTKNKQPQTCKG